MATAAVTPKREPTLVARKGRKIRLKPSTIDQAAQKYLALKLEEESLEQRMKDAREDLLKMVARYGVTPSRAEKSKRIEGDVYAITATFGTSTSLDQQRVWDFRDTLGKYEGGRHLFALVFAEERKYVLQPGGLDLAVDPKVNGVIPRARFLQLFQRCLKLAERKPSLSVEEKASQ